MDYAAQGNSSQEYNAVRLNKVNIGLNKRKISWISISVELRSFLIVESKSMREYTVELARGVIRYKNIQLSPG